MKGRHYSYCVAVAVVFAFRLLLYTLHYPPRGILVLEMVIVAGAAEIVAALVAEVVADAVAEAVVYQLHPRKRHSLDENCYLLNGSLAQHDGHDLFYSKTYY